MNKYVHPEFFKAFDHYKAMLEQYGEHHPITEQALILTMHYTPEHIKAEMHQKAKELNLLPPPSGYTDDGEPIVKLLYYSYKIRKKLEITHRLSRSTILYAYV